MPKIPPIKKRTQIVKVKDGIVVVSGSLLLHFFFLLFMKSVAAATNSYRSEKKEKFGLFLIN